MKGIQMPDKVNKDTPASELINSSPAILNYLVRNGVCGIRCEFPITGTLEQMAKEKDFSETELEKTVIELNNLII